jgi:biotin carboxyl carrier protein
VFSVFGGEVEVIDILVKVGDQVTEGMVVASIEAMKAQHDIKAPCAGTVSSVNVRIGDEIDQSQCILTIS